MKKYNRLVKNLLFPPIWVMVFLTIISTVSLVLVFVNGLDSHPISYMIYVIAFYTLSVIVIFCAMVLPGQYRAAKQRIYDNKYGNLFFTDPVYRTRVSLYVSLGVNWLYAGTNIVSGVLYDSNWFWILAGYYIILAVMRFILLRYTNKNSIGKCMTEEWKSARICASILTLINLVLPAAVLMIMYQDKGFEYHGMLIYVMAMYTFYTTSLAIVNTVKYRKYNSPVLSTTKIITLAAALVSMLSLETAMLNAFGVDTPQQTKRILIAATGAAISVVVLGMSSYMIVRSTKEIRRLKREKINERPE